MLYVDIATDTTVTQNRVESVDLDLDVVRWADGRVEVLDTDEFVERAETMSYPSEVVAEAPRIAEHITRLLTKQLPPFSVAPPHRWLWP